LVFLGSAVFLVFFLEAAISKEVVKVTTLKKLFLT
jgi:hypothetical protein